jgi:GH15 family glucan-1,4-alpha-glucosidase
MIINKNFITPLRPERRKLVPDSIYDQQFVSSFFFDFIDGDDSYIAMTFLMKNVFKIYLNVWRNQQEFINYLKKFKDEFKNAYNYYQELLITTKQHIYEESHVIACFFTFDDDLREILTIYVNELFCNFIDDISH